MCNPNWGEQADFVEAKRLLLTEQLIKYFSTGCDITPEMKEEALELGIDTTELAELVAQMYKDEPEEDAEDDEVYQTYI